MPSKLSSRQVEVHIHRPRVTQGTGAVAKKSIEAVPRSNIVRKYASKIAMQRFGEEILHNNNNNNTKFNTPHIKGRVKVPNLGGRLKRV